VYGIDAPLAGFRFHGDSRSTADRYMAEVNGLLEEWKKSGDRKKIARGFCTVMRHWEDGISSWAIKRHGGEEFIWITKFIEQKITDLLWGLCGIFYVILKLVLLIARTFLLPVRRKAPWNY
jgi:hypothetical protein